MPISILVGGITSRPDTLMQTDQRRLDIALADVAALAFIMVAQRGTARVLPNVEALPKDPRKRGALSWIGKKSGTP